MTDALLGVPTDDFGDYMADKQAGKSFILGPSSASACYRQSAYRYLDVEPSNQVSADAANLGTLLHLGWSALIKSRYTQYERDVDVPLQASGMPRGGEADDVDYVNRVVTDLKSTKDSVFQMWMRQGPYDHFWEQLEVYALALRERHGGDWTLRIMAFNRETGQSESFERPADPEVGRAIVDRIATRHEALVAAQAQTFTTNQDRAIDVAEQFPREGKGPGRGFPCDWCPFLDTCWPDPTSDDGTPQSATVDPEDQAVIAAFAVDYLEARATESKAEKAKKDAAVFLAGLDTAVPDPRDPDYELTVKMVGGNPKQVPDCEAMAEKLESLGFAPIVKDVFTARYPKVGRRKASRK